MDVFLLCDIDHDWLSWPWHERCLALYGFAHHGLFIVGSTRRVTNTAQDKRNRFNVAVDGHCIGVVHSHNDGSPPSSSDYNGIPHGWLGGVYYKGDIAWYVKEPGLLTPARH